MKPNSAGLFIIGFLGLILIDSIARKIQIAFSDSGGVNWSVIGIIIMVLILAIIFRKPIMSRYSRGSKLASQAKLQSILDRDSKNE